MDRRRALQPAAGPAPGDRRGRIPIGGDPGLQHGFADLRAAADAARIESAPGSEEGRFLRRPSRVPRYAGARHDVDALESAFYWIHAEDD